MYKNGNLINDPLLCTLQYKFCFHATCALVVKNLKPECIVGIDLLSCQKFFSIIYVEGQLTVFFFFSGFIGK